MTIASAVRATCRTVAESHGVVVLEGCDGVGKTTVAQYLTDHHGFVVIHSTRSPDGVALLDRYRAIVGRLGLLALDRSFISELIYGPLRYGRSRLRWEEAVELVGLVVARGGVFIHLTADPRCILDRLHARHDGEVWTLDQVRRIQKQYEDVFDALRADAPVVTQRTDLGF